MALPGIEIALQLVYRSEIVAEDVEHLLVLAGAHEDERVRETGLAIREQLAGGEQA
jgi:hypothetical protein